MLVITLISFLLFLVIRTFFGMLFSAIFIPIPLEALEALLYWGAAGAVIVLLGILATLVWMIVDLFSVSKWAREYNTALVAKIQSGQG